MHFYTREGNKAYTVPNVSSGGERPTTVRDAKKLNLVPSVTTIIGQLNKDGIESWKMEKLLDFLRYEEVDFSTIANNKEVLSRFYATDPTGSERGTLVHNELEKFYLGQPITEQYKHTVEVVAGLIDVSIGIPRENWQPEVCFGSDLGFGGQIDLYSEGYIVDFKTKGKDAVGKKDARKEYAMQLAAYRVGHFGPKLHKPICKCYNVFISTTKPGEVYIHEWAEEELQQAYKQFEILLEYWKISNNYRP